MSVDFQRAISGAAAMIALASFAAPLSAQVDRDEVLDALVECADIAEVMARVACYDSNIAKVAPRRASAAPVVQSQPRPGEPPQPRETGSRPSAGTIAAQSPPAAPPARPIERAPGPAPEAQQASRSTGIVASITERAPGAYLVTLQDGSAWEFADSVSATYRPPERGSSVEIEPGALGSSRLLFDRQRPVRVRRVR